MFKFKYKYTGREYTVSLDEGFPIVVPKDEYDMQGIVEDLYSSTDCCLYPTDNGHDELLLSELLGGDFKYTPKEPDEPPKGAKE